MHRNKLAAIAFVVAQATVSQASILTFDTGQADNQDLSLSFGSNLSAAIDGANISNGTTPSIGLSWAPSSNVLELHSASAFANLGDGQILQLDLNNGEADPTITFTVAEEAGLKLNSLDIGHATDMTEPAHAWTLSIAELGGAQVFTHTTAALAAGDTETVTFNFTGEPGVDYVLKFVDGGADHVRGAIDNLNFSEIEMPAATVIEFNGISGSNNEGIPAGFGSNLSSSISGVSVSSGGTPGIALNWADAGAWDLHGSGNSYWAALDADSAASSTPTIAQMEEGNMPVYIDFTVADSSQLILNSVDLGMATDKSDTYNFTITVAELGGAVVETYTPPAMDGDGSSGVEAQTLDLNFTGKRGVHYRLQFEDVPDTNGGAIDNLSFSEVVSEEVAEEEAITQYRYRPFSGITQPTWVSSYQSASTVLPTIVEQQRGTASDAFQDFSFGIFDGTNTVYACDDDVANNDISKDFSVLAVLSPSSTTGTQTICSTFTTDRQEGFRLAVTNGLIFGELVFADGTIHTVTASEPVVAGNWYQIGYRLMADAAAQTQSVDLWINSTKVASSTFSDVNQINHSPLDPAIGADLNQLGEYTDFLDARVYSVQLDDYGISDFFMEAPLIRDGSRGLGAPSFHDYIGSTKPLAKRISETYEESQYAELRSRLDAHYFFPFTNDNYIPQGIAADEQNNRIFLSMYYKDTSGGNLDNHASLIAEILMPEGRLGNVFLLHNEDASPSLSHVGGIAYRDGHLYVADAQDLLVFSIADQPASSFDPDTLSGFAPINIQPIKRFSSMVSFDSIAFVNIHTDTSDTAWLTLGDFDSAAPSTMDLFELTTSTSAVYRSSSTEVQNKAQGVLVYYDDQATKLTLLSKSYGSADSGIYTGTYTNGVAEPTLSSLLLSGPAGFEDVVEYNDALWTTSESGAKYFQKRTTSTPWSPLFPFLFSMNIDDLIDATMPGTVLHFNNISGSNNDAIPAGFGSSLSGNIPGATVLDGGTPGIALTWADGGAWELQGSENSYWSTLDAAGTSSSTPTVGQMELGNLPVYIDFTVADGSQLVLNSVGLGMANNKTDTYNLTITIAEVSGDVVRTFTPPAMDGDGSSGVTAQTVNLSFTGDPSVAYRLQFGDSPDTNGGAIDNLSFSQIVGVDTTPPSLSVSDSLSPAAGSNDVSLTADFVLTFHEYIGLGSGSIVIRRLADDSVVDSIAVSSDNVVIDGAQVTITPSAPLEEMEAYYIEIDAGAFLDLAGNSFAGISGSDTWSFTTSEGLRLHIAGKSSTVNFWWEGSPNKVYDLLSTTNLLLPSDSWEVYDPDGNAPFSDIAFGGTITTLPVVQVADPRRFFSLLEKDAPLLGAAHRGDSFNAPENTVASITSIAGTAELSEMDAQLTSDGVLVLMHDNTINRTTNGTGTVASMTLAQIQALDAGSWFSAAFAGEQVPTLVSAINAAIANDIEPLIERKKGDASVYHAEFVEQALSVNDFRVISFDPAFLNALNSLNTNYRLGLLGTATITQAVIDQAKADGADFLSWKDSVVDQAVVDLVNANGLELMVWTVNDADRMQELIDLGVRGITTDNPALLRSLLP